MWKDVRFGARLLLKQPGFTSIAVLTLALGIGATSAVFSLIQGVLLTPPPYQDPKQLVLIPTARTDGRKTASPRGWSLAQLAEWPAQVPSLEAIASYSWLFTFAVEADGSESLEGMWVTGDYFRVVGLQPVVGRSFLPSETGPEPAAVIILGYDFWQRKFNGDPHVVGKTMRISGRQTPPTIVGVMPPGVRFLPSPMEAQEPSYDVNGIVDFWMPAGPIPRLLKEPRWSVVGRLKRGATLERAQAELTVVAARQAQADRDFDGVAPRVQSLTDELNSDGRRILLPLFGASALVLLIACGNVAALLLVRGLQRQQEYAVRSALGIGRVALFRQVCTESLLLALTGGVAGIALAFGIVKAMKLIGSHAIPRLDAVTTGWPVLLCGLGAAVVAAVLAGLFPAVRASGMDPMPILKSAGPKSSAGRGERRLLQGVTMMQTALTLALLVGAGLLLRTMSNLSQVQSGYHTDRLVTMTVTAVQGDRAAFHARALEQVSKLPGVDHVAFAWGVPLTGNSWPMTVEIEGQPAAAREVDRLSIPLRAVTSGYFELLGLPLTDGRDVRATDGRGAPTVAIVNRALADRYFPRTTALGKKLWVFGRQQPPAEVIGVVGNGRTDDLTQSAEPEIYLSLWQSLAFSKDLVIRTSADPRSVVAAVQRELHAVDPTVAVEHVRTLEQIRRDSVASRTFATQLLVGFALVGSVLTVIGIYGVLSLSVASRRREIAIRAAVGADRKDIRNLVLAEGFRLTAGGVVLGLAAAFIFSRILRSFLFDVEPGDPATLAGAGVVFVSVALLACWVPTRRAANVNPIEALRSE
jgi:putative ABC transport system permease protein